MSQDIVIERFFETIVSGARPEARRIIEEQTHLGVSPQSLITDLFWPTYDMVERLHRDDQITAMGYHLSTRLLRTIVDQNASNLLARIETPPAGRRVFAACGPDEGSELGAQMGVDLLEAHGFRVRFSGGGVPADEIQSLVFGQIDRRGDAHDPCLLTVGANNPHFGGLYFLITPYALCNCDTQILRKFNILPLARTQLSAAATAGTRF